MLRTAVFLREGKKWEKWVVLFVSGHKWGFQKRGKEGRELLWSEGKEHFLVRKGEWSAGYTT